MDRRKFLTSGAQLLGAGLALRAAPTLGNDVVLDGATAAMADSTGAPGNLPDLVVASGEARAATLRALEAIGGMRRFVQPGQVVAVKPNASFSRPPEWGATTHPEVLAGVIEACLAAGALAGLDDEPGARPQDGE